MHEDELIMFSLGIGLSFLLGFNYSIIKNFPFSKIFLFAFYILLFAWLFTILEGFFLSKLFNILEHMAYATSSVFLALWFYRAFCKQHGDS